MAGLGEAFRRLVEAQNKHSALVEQLVDLGIIENTGFHAAVLRSSPFSINMAPRFTVYSLIAQKLAQLNKYLEENEQLNNNIHISLVHDVINTFDERAITELEKLQSSESLISKDITEDKEISITNPSFYVAASVLLSYTVILDHEIMDNANVSEELRNIWKNHFKEFLKTIVFPFLITIACTSTPIKEMHIYKIGEEIVSSILQYVTPEETKEIPAIKANDKE